MDTRSLSTSDALSAGTGVCGREHQLQAAGAISAGGTARMSTSKETLAEWLAKPEGEHLEFKAASENFPFEKLVRYCAALANEGGGKMILVFWVRSSAPWSS